MCPKISILRYLRRGTYTGLRSAIHLLPTSIRNLPGSPYLPYIQPRRAFLRSLSTLHFLEYSGAFSIYSCNPSGVDDFPTKSSANINPDTVTRVWYRMSKTKRQWDMPLQCCEGWAFGPVCFLTNGASLARNCPTKNCPTRYMCFTSSWLDDMPIYTRMLDDIHYKLPYHNERYAYIYSYPNHNGYFSSGCTNVFFVFCSFFLIV